MKRKVLLLILTLLMLPLIISAQTKEWSLEDCILYALQNNIQLKQQEITTQYKASELELSKLSLLPNLNGSASHYYNFGRVADMSTYQFIENQTVRSNNFDASSTVTLFSGLQNYNTIKKNTYNLQASVQDLEALKDNISLNIAIAYLQILLNKELVNATASQVDLTQQQIDRTKKLVDAGSLAKGNLLDIEAQAASEELQLTTLQNNLAISNLTLAQMLEIDSVNSFRIVTPDIIVNPVDVEGNPTSVYSIAEEKRPEILSAENSLKASEFDLAIAKGGRSPKLQFGASMGTMYNSSRKKVIFGPDGVTPIGSVRVPFNDQIDQNLNYGLGFSLSVPIFNGWQVNKSIQNAKRAIQYSEYTLEATKKTLYKNIAQAFADAQGALRKYYSSKKAVESMEEAFRYSEQKFNVGMVNAVDYNQAKTKLLNAQSEMAQAKYEYVFKTKVLDFYKGLPLTLEQIGVISK
ncbi:MAG TPA: TolC family protein [Bacteroidales bacterium]|nr:TolC family protein [Bacteroidales bacterium]